MNRYFIPILEQTNVWLLCAAAISILFFYFSMRVRFSKKPSIKGYAIFFYAFVFYAIATLSYVILNATSNFFRLSEEIYFTGFWFFPLGLISAAIGALCGWLIYTTAVKVAAPYGYRLLNLSLLFIIPSLVFTLLIKPLNQTFEVLTQPLVKTPPKEINTILLEEVLPDTQLVFVQSVPLEFFDSLQVSVLNGKLAFVNPANGFSFKVPVALKQVAQVYVNPAPGAGLLAVLLLSPPLLKQSELLLINSSGNCVYKKLYPAYYNVLSCREKGYQLRLQERLEGDSLSEGITYSIPDYSSN